MKNINLTKNNVVQVVDTVLKERRYHRHNTSFAKNGKGGMHDHKKPHECWEN